MLSAPIGSRYTKEHGADDIPRPREERSDEAWLSSHCGGVRQISSGIHPTQIIPAAIASPATRWS